jgi:hypothetical protein
MKKALVFAALLFLAIQFQATADKFLPDDPVSVDPDRLSIPKPHEIDIARVHDFFQNTFFHPGSDHVRAQNVNTLGKVPDSSWFTNRIGEHPMTVEEVVKGPDRRNGPEMSKAWTVLKAKTDGATPGFVIKDGRGDTYYIKLDARPTPELQSSAEVISTKFFYSFGYTVPENFIAYLNPSMLKVHTPKTGQHDALTQAQVDALLANEPKRSDGTIRVLASLQLQGEPLGGFKFVGTRSDDPNDIIPHENRRELRGYRVFASWLNHTDSDAKNTLDMYVSEGGRKFVKHCVIDFGTTLGSSAYGEHIRREGFEYRVDGVPTLLSFVTLGLYDREWLHIDYPNYPSVGRLEAAHFEPEKWKADYPNPAMIRMDDEDAFWAARIVSKFTDEMVSGIVRTAQMSDPAAERYMTQTLIERRNKIVQYYFAQLNPLSDFSIASAELKFKNLGEEAGIGTVQNYEYEWYRFNNRTNQLTPIGSTANTMSASIAIPRDESDFLMVRIKTISEQQSNWAKKVDVYLRNGAKVSVVGIERETE